MNIEKLFNPRANELNTDEETATAVIFDAEIDPYECNFNNDDCVEINTEGYTHITLTLENLATLRKLIIKAKRHYSKNF